MKKNDAMKELLAERVAKYIIEHPFITRKDFGLEKITEILVAGLTLEELQALSIKYHD